MILVKKEALLKILEEIETALKEDRSKNFHFSLGKLQGIIHVIKEFPEETGKGKK